MAKPKSNPIERFMRFVEPVTESGCWIWMGALNNKGYGRFTFDISYSGELAHRVSWKLFVGNIPNGLNVLHRCDIPCCVNPAHFFIGTIRDNAIDMMNKGRGAIGERQPCAKLTEQQVVEIRALLGSVSQRIIADRYGVKRPLISKIACGTRWKHV